MAKREPAKSVDFFISYATSDEAMAKEIGAILEGAGYSYIAQFRDFRPGTNFVREMQRGLEASSRLIALLSAAYEKSNNCQAEWSAAYAEDPGSEHGKIVPFLISEGKLNPLARQIVYRSLVGLSSDQRRAAVLEAIKPWMNGGDLAKTAGVGGSVPDCPEADPPRLDRANPGNLPISIGHLFKGREEFLRQLHESFRHKAAAAITGKAVHGLGGIGKTRVAIEYAHAYSGDYAGTFFLIGKSESDLKDSLAALTGAAVLDLPEKDNLDLEARVAAVIRWLRANPGWLLLIDNVDDKSATQAVRQLLDWVGGGGGHILITSRISDWGHVVHPLELDLLSTEAAMDLLRESTPRRTRGLDEDSALISLAKEQLGCLSLALVQAAAYIEERRISFADYSALFQKESTKLLTKLGAAAVRDLSYPLPVALTWQASIAQLGTSGRLLLDMLAWLSIEPIPRNLFDVWPQVEIDLEEALAELTRYSFVHWEAGNSAISLHRLVAHVTRDNMIPSARDEALNLLFPWLVAVNPKMSPDDVRCWPQLLPLLPHAVELHRRTSNIGPYRGQITLYNEYATLLESLARYSEAEPLYRTALAISEAAFGPGAPEVAGRISNLAGLLKVTNRLAEAEALFRRALNSTDVKNSEAYRSTAAIIMNNLAELLQSNDQLIEAEQLYREALEITREVSGPNHPNLAIRYNNLATLLQMTGRFAEAESLFRIALEIDEANYGVNHPQVALRYNNLAALLHTTGQLIEAEPLYRSALEIDEASFGENHPKVANRLNNLAGLLRVTGRVEEAEQLHRRALEINEESFGGDHPLVATCLNNLALIFVETKRYVEAEPLYNRAIRIDEASYGFDHPEVATDLLNLAGLLQATGRITDAEPLYRRAILIFLRSSRASGHLLPTVSIAFRNYAAALLKAGRETTQTAAALASVMTEAAFDPAELWSEMFGEET